MSGSGLTPLQVRLIEILAMVSPPGILTSGAALIGLYTGHRVTRDLGFRWPDLEDLHDVVRDVAQRLRIASLESTVLQTTPTFQRLRVAGADGVVLVDLIVDSLASVEEPHILTLGETKVRVDTPHEILVNKLCALLGRMEIRDLQDLRELLRIGGDLERALRDAPLKDGGFSPLTLAWVLQGMPAARVALAEGLSSDDALTLEAFRRELIDRLLTAAAPE